MYRLSTAPARVTPRAVPMPLNAEASDIVVPLSMGTCSRVRLEAAASKMPTRNEAVQRSARKIPKSCMKKESNINRPAKKLAATASRFLPTRLTT